MAAAVTCFSLLIFVTILTRALFVAADTEVRAPDLDAYRAAQQEALATSHASLPERLFIPAIGVDAMIEEVSVNTDGNMKSPGSYSSVGWYKYGTIPGEIGNAVIAGHIDNGLGLDGVFKHLSALRKGDQISIITKDGMTRRFTVNEIVTYPYTEVPNEALFGNSGRTRLILITCAGRWITGDKTYDQRLIVSAELAMP